MWMRDKLCAHSCQWAHNMLATCNGEMTLMDTWCRCCDDHIACYADASLLQENKTTEKTYREWHPLTNLSLCMMVMHTGGSVASTPEATEDMQRAGFKCAVLNYKISQWNCFRLQLLNKFACMWNGGCRFLFFVVFCCFLIRAEF